MLRFLLDEHMPKPLARYIAEQGYEAAMSTRALGFSATDTAIAAWADANGYVLITKDLDFKHSHYRTGSPRRVVRLMIGNCSAAETVAMFAAALPLILAQPPEARFHLEIY